MSPMKSPPDRLVVLPGLMRSIAAATLSLFCTLAVTSSWSFETYTRNVSLRKRYLRRNDNKCVLLATLFPPSQHLPLSHHCALVAPDWATRVLVHDIDTRSYATRQAACVHVTLNSPWSSNSRSGQSSRS